MPRAHRVPNGPSLLPALPTVPGFIDTALVKPRAGLSDADATRQMADDMRLGAFREGGVTRESLALLGYTTAQIDRLGDRARQRAQQLAGAGL